MVLRMLLVRVMVMFLTPYLTRFFDRLAVRAPQGSFLQETLLEFGNSYSLTVVRSLGTTLGGLLFDSDE
jgi:hypothetical protein